jgi:hypothetical protein
VADNSGSSIMAITILSLLALCSVLALVIFCRARQGNVAQSGHGSSVTGRLSFGQQGALEAPLLPDANNSAVSASSEGEGEEAGPVIESEATGDERAVHVVAEQPPAEAETPRV